MRGGGGGVAVCMYVRCCACAVARAHQSLHYECDSGAGSTSTPLGMRARGFRSQRQMSQLYSRPVIPNMPQFRCISVLLLFDMFCE